MKLSAGVSTYMWADFAGVGERYLGRQEKRTKLNPGRDVLLTLAWALVYHTSLFGRRHVDRVLRAAGHPPAARRERSCPGSTCAKTSSSA